MIKIVCYRTINNYLKEMRVHLLKKIISKYQICTNVQTTFKPILYYSSKIHNLKLVQNIKKHISKGQSNSYQPQHIIPFQYLNDFW